MINAHCIDQWIKWIAEYLIFPRNIYVHHNNDSASNEERSALETEMLNRNGDIRIRPELLVKLIG